MEKDTEVIDSSTDETSDEEHTDSSTSDQDSKADKYTEREKQYYARMKKAEADAKALREHTDTKKEKSDDFGYDVKAYLKASGIKASEFDFVKAELKASGGKDVDALLENEYFTAKLEKHREIAKTQDAIPKGKRTGGVATDSVDYWMAKPIDEVPTEMRRAVVNAKLEREKGQGKFYNS